MFKPSLRLATVLTASAASLSSSSTADWSPTFCFASSIRLEVCTAVIYGQTLYAQSIDAGYESDNKLVLGLRGAQNTGETLRQELLNLPEVSSVVLSSEAPTQDNENNTQFTLLETHAGGGANEPQLLNYHNMGFGFFEAYEIEPIAGRLFSENYGTDMIRTVENEGDIGNASVILNVRATRKLGFSNPEDAIGKTLGGNVHSAGMHHLTIVGVIPDIYFRSIKFAVRPTIYLNNPTRFRVASLTFETDDMPGLMNKVEQIWKNNVPMQPVSMQFLTEMMHAQYQDEETQAKLFLVFSILAIVVACLGLYGLAAFTTERRTREIGIRKVMGARVRDIVTLLIWQFSKPVFVANIIAWPLSAYAMLSWLESFPYRIDAWWLIPVCLAVGVLLMLMAWLTVGGNAARVARANPIRALRQE